MLRLDAFSRGWIPLELGWSLGIMLAVLTAGAVCAASFPRVDDGGDLVTLRNEEVAFETPDWVF